MRIALVGGTVVDGRGGPPLVDSTVVVDGTKIAAVGKDVEVAGDTTVIDVTGATVMPGLIDSHVHFASWAQWLSSHPDDRLMYLASRTAYGLARTLEFGVTTARDLGGLEAGFVKAVDEGLIPGPRLQTCVIILHPTNGVSDNIPGVGGATSKMGLHQVIPGMPSPYCDGPWEARAKVRQAVRAGAHVIKIASSSQTVAGDLQWDTPAFTQEEVAAIVDEAHAIGLKVTSHAMGQRGVLTAVRAGVDGIEHGWALDDQALEEMALRGTWLIPTLFIAEFHMNQDPSPAARAHAAQMLEAAMQTVSRAKELGVRIAMGSDAGEHAIGGTLRELALLSQAGLTPAEIIVASTSAAAEWLGMDDLVGTLEIGKEADLIVVDGDPLEDVEVLQPPFGLVLRAGEPVAGQRREEIRREPPPVIQRLLKPTAATQ